MKQTAQSKPITDLLATLAEPIRLRLVRVLEVSDLAVGEIASVVQLPQSTVSRHLRVLAEGGWLTSRSEGPATYYRVVLDDLPPPTRLLWLAVREQALALPEGMTDQRRLAMVLAERRTNSRDFFGRVAGQWDEVRTELFGARFTPLALLHLLPSTWVVADLGCGTGNAAELLAPSVQRVIAVDQSEAMLEAARRRLAGASNVEFKAGSLEELPLKDASVDAAVCFLVLHHLAEPERALAEAARVLRSDRGGGLLLIVDMINHDRREYRHSMGHQHLGFSAEHMRRMMTQAGLSQVSIDDLPSVPEARGPGLFVAVGRK